MARISSSGVEVVSGVGPREHAFLNTPWWAMGQRVQGHTAPRINETATRARAGMLNVISATTLALLLLAPATDPVRWVGPYVLFDMLTAAAFGLTPLCPTGVLGTALTLKVRPTWKPTAPKRFAWLLGASLAATCLTMRIFGASPGSMALVVAVCFCLTWLEAALGFCVGCWMHGRFFGCETCDAPYVRH
jgi:hypothetical protein